MGAQAWIAFAALLVVIFVQTATIAYWMGGQSARNKSNSARIEILEKVRDGDAERHIALIRELSTLAAQVGHVVQQVKALERLMEGANRALSSLVTRRKGVIPPMGDTQTDY